MCVFPVEVNLKTKLPQDKDENHTHMNVATRLGVINDVKTQRSL